MAHFEPRAAKVKATNVKAGRRPSVTADQIRERVARYADFAARFPQLLPAPIRSDAFIAQLLEEAPLGRARRRAPRRCAGHARGLFAFCHWNANIDNAWFWRDEHGDIACGLMDWGNVGQMNMVTAISSCLIFAEPDFVIEHLDHFLALFSRCSRNPVAARSTPRR